MQEILLVNPARRPSKRSKSAKRASPAQLRARAKFAAAARARSKKGAAVMSNPKRRTSRHTAKRTALRANPAPRTHHAKKRVHHRRRRNPIGGSTKPMSLLTPALIGALGATTVNTVLAQLSSFLPASLVTGNMSYITRIAASLGLAACGGLAGNKRAFVAQMAEGSLTVVLHDAIVGLSSGMGMTLSGNRSGMRGLGVYMPGVGARQQVPYAGGATPIPGGLSDMGAYMTGGGSPQGVVLPISAARRGGMRGFSRGF